MELYATTKELRNQEKYLLDEIRSCARELGAEIKMLFAEQQKLKDENKALHEQLQMLLAEVRT